MLSSRCDRASCSLCSGAVKGALAGHGEAWRALGQACAGERAGCRFLPPCRSPNPGPKLCACLPVAQALQPLAQSRILLLQEPRRLRQLHAAPRLDLLLLHRLRLRHSRAARQGGALRLQLARHLCHCSLHHPHKVSPLRMHLSQRPPHFLRDVGGGGVSTERPGWGVSALLRQPGRPAPAGQ